jgi:hypothetical protein
MQKSGLDQDGFAEKSLVKPTMLAEVSFLHGDG